MVVELIPINYWAIFSAAVVSFIFGGIWYNLLFGRTWEKLNKVRMGVGKPRWALLLGNLIIAFVVAWTLVHTLRYTGADTLFESVLVTFFTWLGYFALTTSLGNPCFFNTATPAST